MKKAFVVNVDESKFGKKFVSNKHACFDSVILSRYLNIMKRTRGSTSNRLKVFAA